MSNAADQSVSVLPCSAAESNWQARYASKYRPIRIRAFPEGIVPPKRVRIYRRNTYYLLQWWDPSQRKTLVHRLDGDLLDAIMNAREIESRLNNYKSSGHVSARIRHDELVAKYIDDLLSRANAGEIDQRTVDRYSAPLKCHYLPFTSQPDVARRFRYITEINRDFQLAFSHFLQSRFVHPNGSESSISRPMRGQRYVLDVVRSMLHWAADGDRGNLLPAGFQNPFRRSNSAGGRDGGHGLSEPDITMDMAIAFMSSCDDFQLPIFATLALYGLRPDELGWIFQEDIHDGWARIGGHPELGYMTKGRRDKQFPLLPCLQDVWPRTLQSGKGLLFHSRRSIKQAISSLTKADLVNKFVKRRCDNPHHSAAEFRQLRGALLVSSGQLAYDHVRTEFCKIAKHLAWPRCATAKDFRHLFATSLENAVVPESYRRFLMGHAPGRAAIVTYTHLNKLREHYLRAIETEFAPLVNAIQRRAYELRTP